MSFVPFQTPLQSIASFAHLASQQISTAHASSSQSPLKQADSLNLDAYDVDVATGFLPAESPITRLPAAFEAWELALDLVNCDDSILSLGEDTSSEGLAKRESSTIWRENIRALPTISIKCLEGNLPQLRRAHLVLAYLTHFYVHSIPPTGSSPHVPASLAVPLVACSRVLGIAPILTYSDTVLWNYAPIDASKPLSLSNMRFQTLFTGTDDEANFYHCCASIEAQGVDALHIMDAYENTRIEGSSSTAPAQITRSLEQLADIIEDLTTILTSVHSTCAPRVFYDLIRPWFRGSNGDAEWVYEGVPDSDSLLLSGPSGGQSTMMHSLDVFLDVDHALERTDRKEPTELSKRADHFFMRRMQKYMPGPHRAFLHRLAETPLTVREYAMTHSRSGTHPELVEAYNSCVLALRRFRDAHMKVAVVYVVAIARQRQSTTFGGGCGGSSASTGTCPIGAMMAQMLQAGDEAVCPVSGNKASAPVARKGVRGTGGTELQLLLRSCRDATTRSLIPRSSA